MLCVLSIAGVLLSVAEGVGVMVCVTLVLGLFLVC